MADFSTEEINKLLKDVHSGKTHLFNLPVNVYKRVAEGLTNRVYEAFNLDVDTNLLSPDFEPPRQLKRNAYIFSAAKTFQEVQDMQNFLFNDKGFKRQFNEFEKEARQIFDTYNKNWLEAEYETALRQAESAADWERIQAEKDIFPLLRYKTLSDGSVRQEHQTLHNIVRPVDDPFWDRFTPPNGWRCRCFTEQLEEDEAQITPITQSGGKIYKKNRRWQQEVEQPNKLFDFNPAKEGVIFREDAQGKGLSHPYFKVSERWEVHKRNNFGLPLPNDIKDLQPLRTIGKQKVKVSSKKVKPTPLKTTPVEVTPTEPIVKLDKQNTYSTFKQQVVNEVEDIANNQDGAAEIANEKRTVLGVRKSSEKTKTGATKWYFATDARIRSFISKNSNGNCAIDNSFLNIVVKSGENSKFEKVDLDLSLDDILNGNLTVEKHRDGSYIYQSSKRTWFTMAEIRNGKPKVWSMSTASKLKSKSVGPTVTHEFNHLIHNKYDPKVDATGKFSQWGERSILKKEAEIRNITLEDSVTLYGEKNWSEFWAENMTAYIHAHEYLKNTHPKIFSFMEEMLEIYGVDKNTFRIAK
jgi:SPP1 gp7 family putative phage head morphogenesis protein